MKLIYSGVLLISLCVFGTGASAELDLDVAKPGAVPNAEACATFKKQTWRRWLQLEAILLSNNPPSLIRVSEVERLRNNLRNVDILRETRTALADWAQIIETFCDN